MESFSFNIQLLLRLAGIAQIVLVTGSFAIPKVLKWNIELAKTNTLIKQMFWTYAAYILVINLCFGLISVLDYRELTNGSNLALLITGFIAAYWISRILIQFLYFDGTSFPSEKWNKLAEILLVTLFIFLSIVYTFTCYINYKQS